MVTAGGKQVLEMNGQSARPLSKPNHVAPELAGFGPDLYRKRAKVKARLGRFAEALADYGRAIRLSPQDATLYLERGELRRQSGDVAGAIDEVTKAIEVERGERAETYVRRGRLQTEIGCIALAIRDYDAAIRRDPACPGAFFEKGKAEHELGDDRAAETSFTADIERLGGSAVGYWNRHIVRRRLGNDDGAFADLDEALALLSRR